MKKAIVIYQSLHHENTKKLLEGMGEKCPFDMVSVSEAESINLMEYEIIGFASGIFYGKLHNSILEFVKTNPTMPDRCFVIFTRGSNNKKYANSLIRLLEEQNRRVLGVYHCKGFDTYGLWKWIGGIARNHPNREDVEKGIAFIEKFIK